MKRKKKMPESEETHGEFLVVFFPSRFQQKKTGPGRGFMKGKNMSRSKVFCRLINYFLDFFSSLGGFFFSSSG